MTIRTLILHLLLAGVLAGCPGGGEPRDGEKKTAFRPRDWVILAATIDRGLRGDAGADPSVIRRGILALPASEIEAFLTWLGSSKACIDAYTVGDDGLSPLRMVKKGPPGGRASWTEYVFLRIGEASFQVEIGRSVSKDNQGRVGFRDSVKDVKILKPGDLLDLARVRARLACPDWRVATRPFEGSPKGPALRSKGLRFFACSWFLRHLAEGGWAPGELERARYHARILEFEEQIDGRVFSDDAQARARALGRVFVSWAVGQGTPESWRRGLEEAFRRVGIEHMGGSQRCLELMAMLCEVGHGSSLPRKFSGLGVKRNYTRTFSPALVEGMLGCFAQGGEAAGVAAVALRSGVDPYLSTVLAEHHRDRFVAALVEGLGCASPVIRHLAVRHIEEMTGRRLAAFRPFLKTEAARRDAEREKKRFQRTRFGPNDEEVQRRRNEKSVQGNLLLLSSLNNLRRPKAGIVTMDVLVGEARKRGLSLPLSPTAKGWRDRWGFFYEVRTGPFLARARGSLHGTEPVLLITLDETVGETFISRPE
jgi:hypothetical protein